MVWILLAAVGVPLWLVAGMLLYTLRSRRQVRRTPGVFRCRLRQAGAGEGEGPRWSSTKRYACWTHDVLLVHRGPTLARCEALPVASVTGLIVTSAVKGLGKRPVQLRLHLDDGRLMDLAASGGDVMPAAGPFVAATMS